MIRSKLFAENIKMALETIRTHKVRSFLTVLGVVIGVLVAIVVASILIGFENGVQASLNEFGVNNLWVFRFNFGFSRLTPEERMRKPLTLEDGLAIKQECAAVKNVSISVFERQGVRGPHPPRIAKYKGKEVFLTNFYGSTPSYVEVDNGGIQAGRFFGEAEDLHRTDVVALGYDVAQALFPNESGVGKPLQIDGSVYTVIGIFEKKKNATLGGGDDDVILPYRTYRKRYPADDEHFIAAMAYPGMKAVAEDEIRGLLRLRRRVPPDKPDSFGISSAEQLGEQFRDILAKTAMLIVSVVSIGLLVGGVGVMNIMLMSVTERTREIGVRKAIGARKRDITMQFITEAMTLTGAGGVIGVVLSLAISFLLRSLDFPSQVPLWAIVIAVAVACSVGLFFGIYPAVKAARLDPVIALRYE
jgi:ABC-type antimicrobial peptide transport system permease subunit